MNREREGGRGRGEEGGMQGGRETLRRRENDGGSEGGAGE